MPEEPSDPVTKFRPTRLTAVPPGVATRTPPTPGSCGEACQAAIRATKGQLDAPGGQCQSGVMSKTAKTLLDTFDSLPEPERQEVTREILRRTVRGEYGPPDDEELLALADDVFLELDRGESQR